MILLAPGQPAGGCRRDPRPGRARTGVEQDPSPAGKVGLVALDPTLSISRAYHITALPTTIVVDGRGTVQTVHIGFMEKYREMLGRELETLMAGKSLLKPDAGKAGR